MEKVTLESATGALVVDHCPRCGGVWFEKGEAQRATKHSPAELWKHIPPRASLIRPPCHGCHAPLDRDAERCGACGKKNELACPMCNKAMERRRHAALTLDVCARCRGVWFDHSELRSLWSLTVSDVAARGTGRGPGAAAVTGDVLLESLFWAPGLVIHAGHAAVYGAGHAVGALSNLSVDGAAGAAMGAAELVGGAAESMFETIMGIISSLFD